MQKIIVLGNICKVGNKVIDKIITLLMIIVMLIGSLGLYDAFSIYSKTNVSDDIIKFKPQNDNSKSNPSLLELSKINSDVVGWLTLDDTNVDYPVLQGKDNDQYLNYTVEGEYALSGSIFLDYKNKKDFTSKYSLIYGHHMAGEYMFGIIPKFQEKDFFDKHKSGKLFLINKTYNIEIFASVFTNAFNANIFNPSAVKNKEQLNKIIKYIKNNSKQFRELDWQDGDTLIGFSTCYSASTDGRVVVFGRLREVR